MDGASAGLTPLSPDVECALGVTCHVLLRTYVRVTARDCLSGLKNDFFGLLTWCVSAGCVCVCVCLYNDASLDGWTAPLQG